MARAPLFHFQLGNQANPSTYMILWSLLDFVSQIAAKNQNKLCPAMRHNLREPKPCI